MTKIILVCILSLAFANTKKIKAQSIEINPANPESLISGKGTSNITQVLGKLSKIGTSKLTIEGKSYFDDDNFFGINGSSLIELVGNPFGDPLNNNSRNGINFKHGNVLRWFIGDNYEDFNFSNITKDAFIIKNSNFTPFIIASGSNQVDITNLRIGSDPSTFNDGFLINKGASGEMIINNQLNTPINFQTNNISKLTLLPEGNFGVGKTDPQRKLDVNGNARISSTLEVTGTTTIGGNASLNQNLSVGGTGTITGNATLSQNLSVAGTATISGNSVLNQNLNVSGNTTLNGTTKIGSNGTQIFEIIKTSSEFDLPSINALSSSTRTISVSGVSVGSTVHISPENALPNGILIAYARVSGTSKVEIRFINITTAPINPANNTYYITIIR